MREGLSFGDEDYPKKICSRINASKPQPIALNISFNTFWLAGILNILGSKANISRAPMNTNQKSQTKIITKYKE